MPLFKYGADELNYLQKRDLVLAKAIEQFGFLEREITPDPFMALLQCIVAQQISTKAAETVWKRLSDKFNQAHPENLAAADLAEIKECGLSLRKAGYIKEIAEKNISGAVNFANFAHLSDTEIVKQLSALNGVGVWTAEMVLIFSLSRPDVVSWGDFGIRRGMMNLYGLNDLSKGQFNE